jgi:hypothetical protein
MLLLCGSARIVIAQNLSVDSLEHNGYRVRVYKPQPVRTKTAVRTVHDTIRTSEVHVVVIRDTLIRERKLILVERSDRLLVQSVVPSIDRYTILLIGNANTNGYGMHLGAEVRLGERIAFFIGAGMGYNSVTKATHLDLAGLLTIRLWGGPD